MSVAVCYRAGRRGIFSATHHFIQAIQRTEFSCDNSVYEVRNLLGEERFFLFLGIPSVTEDNGTLAHLLGKETKWIFKLPQFVELLTIDLPYGVIQPSRS